MDAAIGGLLCVGVLNNFSSGIGGGGFMLVRDAKGNPIVIDFRETAAATAHRDMFNQNITLATDSTLSTGVPGEIRGFAMAHAKYGRLPWAKLFEPSIKLAKDGFFVSLKMEQMIEVKATTPGTVMLIRAGVEICESADEIAFHGRDVLSP